MSKYKVIYDRIIESRKKRVNDGQYYERHHIIPRSLGGSDSEDNIVLLTPREHFICHRLLTKFTQGEQKYKMIWALHRMAFSSKYMISSRLYEYVRTQHIDNLKANHPSKKESWKSKVSEIVKQHWCDNFERKKISSDVMKSCWKEGKITPRIGESNGMFGKKPWNAGRKLPGTGLSGSKNPASRSYKIVDKYGNVYYTDCLNEFCKEHGLQPRNMRKVATGELKRHKTIMKVEKLERKESR